MEETIQPIASIANELNRLPGIGRKTALRLAYYIAGMPIDDVRNFAVSVWEGRKAVHYCEVCGNYTSGSLCEICESNARHNGQVCVVRDPRDVAAIERMHEYGGLYHVLQGTLSPIDGIGPEQIRIRELMDRISREKITEVILATNPDVEGEATASYIAGLLRDTGIRVTRIAHGVPVGGDLEYTDSVTLQKAMEGRREIK